MHSLNVAVEVLGEIRTLACGYPSTISAVATRRWPT